MARPIRIEYRGAWYHVMNRGGARRCVFPDNNLRCEFLRLLADAHDRFDIRCHAYCLMGNHYHLLLHTPNARLGRAMRHIDGVYTQRHNRRQATDGPLFRGRYAAQLVEDGDYLWIVSRYIHRNPIEAGLCFRAAEYVWSSYRYFAGDRNGPAWLQRRKTLQQFGGRAAYRAFVESDAASQECESEFLSAQGNEYCPPILGSDVFVEQQLQTVSLNDEIPESKRHAEFAPAKTIVEQLCLGCGWELCAIVRGADKLQRRRRAMLMLIVFRFTPSKLAEIAAVFGLHYSTAGNAIQRMRKLAEADSEIAAELQRLRGLVVEMRKVQT